MCPRGCSRLRLALSGSHLRLVRKHMAYRSLPPGLLVESAVPVCCCSLCWRVSQPLDMMKRIYIFYSSLMCSQDLLPGGSDSVWDGVDVHESVSQLHHRAHLRAGAREICDSLCKARIETLESLFRISIRCRRWGQVWRQSNVLATHRRSQKGATQTFFEAAVTPTMAHLGSRGAWRCLWTLLLTL